MQQMCRRRRQEALYHRQVDSVHTAVNPSVLLAHRWQLVCCVLGAQSWALGRRVVVSHRWALGWGRRNVSRCVCAATRGAAGGGVGV
jgi:hypothetical protein